VKAVFTDTFDMESEVKNSLPSALQITQAVRIYLEVAYGGQCPPSIGRLVPPDSFEPAQWLMQGTAQRDPADAPLEGVRSFSLRLGNASYPHMKLRLSRPPKDNVFLFSVDAHDAFLHAPPTSADHGTLEELKRRNSQMAATITAMWDEKGLPTERNYLRLKIDQARHKGIR
jgi:hypothetical protein